MRFPPTGRNYTRELLVAQIQALVEFLLLQKVTLDAERDTTWKELRDTCCTTRWFFSSSG
jgi:hypothetical protein